MSSSSKRKTTMAKRNRENSLRERRLRKQARKEARKLAAAELRAAGASGPPVADSDPGPPEDASAPA
jgi:tRNA A-37 threonylcarbamoyl transferase component Bud32